MNRQEAIYILTRLSEDMEATEGTSVRVDAIEFALREITPGENDACGNCYEQWQFHLTGQACGNFTYAGAP